MNTSYIFKSQKEIKSKQKNCILDQLLCLEVVVIQQLLDIFFMFFEFFKLASLLDVPKVAHTIKITICT